jgi:hypothetical protein
MQQYTKNSAKNSRKKFSGLGGLAKIKVKVNKGYAFNMNR